jgi:hypothetical protein
MTKIFNAIKSFFTAQTGVSPMNTIGKIDNKFAIFDRQGFVVKTYSRERDARRGAARMGLTVA